MQTRPTFLALLLLAPLLASAGQIYKWVDADGVVQYSDQPHEGAEKTELGTVQTLHMPVAPNAPLPGAQAPQAARQKPAAGLGYTEVAVTSPPQGKTYTDEPVPVSLELQPGLQGGHTITWYLNEAPLPQTEGSFTIERLDRGAYTLYATITDADGTDTVTSKTVTFYVRQPSELAPKAQRH